MACEHDECVLACQHNVAPGCMCNLSHDHQVTARDIVDSIDAMIARLEHGTVLPAPIEAHVQLVPLWLIENYQEESE